MFSALFLLKIVWGQDFCDSGFHIFPFLISVKIALGILIEVAVQI